MRRSVLFGTRRRDRSKKGRASSGPGEASGWNCTLAKPSPASPSQVPSFSETCEMSPSAITAKPWFCTVTSTRPVSTSRTGWFAPRWPNGSLNVLWPSASPSSWWPRQTPKSGTRPSRLPDRLDLLDEHRRVARAVPDQHDARVGLEDRVGVPGARHDVRLDARVREPPRDRVLHAEVDDDDPRPLRRPSTAPSSTARAAAGCRR